MIKLSAAEFKKLDDDIYVLKYNCDYGLDELLKQGVDSVKGLVLFVQKHFFTRRGDVKIKCGDFACTTFNAFNEADEQIFARNFDYKEAHCIVVQTAPPGGYKSVGMTSADVLKCDGTLDKRINKKRLLAAPYVCMDGINEKGLSIAVVKLNTESTAQNTGKTPIITTVMLRAVLDRCATVDEAIALFESFDMHDSLGVAYHYQLADAEGCCAVIEYIDNKLTVDRVEHERLYLLNFYHTPGHPIKGSGYTREKWLRDEFSQTGLVMSEERALKILKRCRLWYRHKKGYQVKTLWSAVFNCPEKTVRLCSGSYNSKVYLFGADGSLSE